MIKSTLKAMQRKRKMKGNYKNKYISNSKGELDTNADERTDDNELQTHPQKKLKKYPPLISDEFDINENNIIINNLVTSDKLICETYDDDDDDLLECQRGVSKISLNKALKKRIISNKSINDARSSLPTKLGSDCDESEINISDYNGNVKSILRKSEKRNICGRKVSFAGIDDQVKESHIYPKDKFQKLKLKKKKKKKSKKNVKSTDCSSQEECTEQVSKVKKASNYLNAWRYNKEEWKFEKLTQAWIIRHMFNAEKISNNIFEILLEYMINIRGAGKTLVLQQCRNIIRSKETKKLDDNSENDFQDDTAYQRARSLLQYIQ